VPAPDLRRDPHNPVEVEWQIEDIQNQLLRGVDIVTEREKAAREARAAADLAYALAIGQATGPAVNHKYHAIRETIAERRAADNAETALHHAERKMRALERALSGWQSILNSAQAMWNSAGVR
jgi:hypothetical protein